MLWGEHFDLPSVNGTSFLAMASRAKEILPLSEAVTHLLEECRMVLPGIQASDCLETFHTYQEIYAATLWGQPVTMASRRRGGPARRDG